MWNTEKIFVHPDLMLCPWAGHNSIGILLLVTIRSVYDWHLHMNHVGHTSHHHVSDCPTLVVLHYVLKRPSSQDSQKVCWKLHMEKSPEEILLEVEI